MKTNREIITLSNQGFCYGVNQSIKKVIQVLKDKSTPKPIYLLNSIVHNSFVNNYFKEQGVIILEGKPKMELLDEISSGTVIFSAHGVGDNVYDKAKNKNLNIVDATCPFVEKSYQLIKKHLNNNYHLLYIGKTKHPEAEAVTSFSDEITLINENNIIIPNTNKPLAIAHQTTMSNYDVEHIYNEVKTKVKDILVLPMICNATKLRQDELRKALTDIDNNSLVIIVGDRSSNNCTKLYELALRYTNNTLFISDYKELINVDLSKYNKFIFSSGTSTPIINVEQISNFIKNNKRPKKENELIDYIK